jgi:hypothetical protein
MFSARVDSVVDSNIGQSVPSLAQRGRVREGASAVLEVKELHDSNIGPVDNWSPPLRSGGGLGRGQAQCSK